jgi:hypothetical protein
MASLRVLVVEKMQHFYPHDAARLSRAAPGLQGLTITLRPYNRPNNPHQRARPRVWPRGAHEYALALRTLPDLREFSWNADSPSHVPAPGWDLAVFENDTPVDPNASAEEDQLWMPNTDGQIADARVFGAYCPALKRVLWPLATTQLGSVECILDRREATMHVRVRTSQQRDRKYYPETPVTRVRWPDVTPQAFNGEMGTW